MARFIPFILFVVVFAFAHDIWLEEVNGRFYLFHGHEEKRDPYDPSRVIGWVGKDKRGRNVALKITRQEGGVYLKSLKGSPALLVVTFDNGYWVKTTEGWKNIGKREAVSKGMAVLESGRSYKYPKYIKAWEGSAFKPVGTPIEIVPLNNPIKSDVLHIRVLLNGKPLAGVPVYLLASHQESTRTDDEGNAVVPVKKGLNIISVSTRVPAEKDPDGDLVYLRASLSFIKR